MESLGALVFAVTVHPDEWRAVSARTDEFAIWGVGAHPADERALGAFDAVRFATALEGALFVGEVGLDHRRGDLARQEDILDIVLAEVQANPRPVSLHSVRASA